jgi:hypothetical protein
MKDDKGMLKPIDTKCGKISKYTEAISKLRKH